MLAVFAQPSSRGSELQPRTVFDLSEGEARIRETLSRRVSRYRQARTKSRLNDSRVRRAICESVNAPHSAAHSNSCHYGEPITTTAEACGRRIELLSPELQSAPVPESLSIE